MQDWFKARSKNRIYGVILPLLFFLIIPFSYSLPNITIDSPTSTNYFDTDLIPFNVSANDTIDNWWYNIGDGNVTFIPNTTLSLYEGNYTLVVWGNATGNISNSSVNFTVYDKQVAYFDLYLVAIFMFIVFLGLGYYLRDIVFKVSSGIISIFIAWELFLVGFPGISNNFLITGLTVVFAGIGLYMLVRPPLDQIQEMD